MTYSNTNFNQKTILITGGAGFIGSNLAFYFQENYPDSQVVVFDCLGVRQLLLMAICKALGITKI